RLRSALTMLGILIGVGSVIVLVAVGNGSSAAVRKQIEGLGTNTLVVSPGFNARGGPNRGGTTSRRVGLTPADVKALSDKQTAPDIKEVAPTINTQQTGTYNGATFAPDQFLGTTPNYPGIRNYKVASGSFFTQADIDDHRRVVVLGTTVVSNLFPAGTNPIGA